MKTDSFLKMTSLISKNEAEASIFAEHLCELFKVIVPERIGKEFVMALSCGDVISALHICAEYYRNKADFSDSELSSSGRYDQRIAENASLGIMREINIDWTFPDGEVDYLFDPTSIKGPINHEWLWQFNRHSYWAHMARKYRECRDEKYAKAFERQLLKWISQTYIPEKWNDPGSAWRTIECGLRLLSSWQIAFDGFKTSPSVDDVTLLLMIASMHRQSVHLINHPTGGNWLMMESNGAYTFSALFDELSDSEDNRRIATERLLRELSAQILPDGMHNELSPDYQSVVFMCAANFYSLSISLGRENEIPEEFSELMRRTVNAVLLLSTPALTQPKTNDTYTIHTEKFTSRAELLFGKQPEYSFVNTCRKEGRPIEGKTASAFLPYAGFAVMRNDWTADSAYMCFDVGPLGCNHMHQDKLNIILYKGDEELIYDDGGGQYEISPSRNYSLSAYSHNTVIVDGKAQSRRGPLRVTEPIDAGWITNDSFDYACAVYDDSFSDGKKPAKHKREVRFCKPGFFCVTDILTSLDDNTHTYEVLFHLDTTKVKEVPEYTNAIISDYGRKYEVLMIPMDEDADVKLTTVSASVAPIYQGWYNGRNESNLHPSITVSRKISDVKDFKFTTLLFPTQANSFLPSVRKLDDSRIEVLFEGKEYIFDIDELNK